MDGAKMNAIIWPDGFTPGHTDNFSSNEVIVAGLSAADIWPVLNTPSLWPTYYDNAANIRIKDSKVPMLEHGTYFSWETFGFSVESQCVECVPPAAGQPGRLAWHAWGGEGEGRVEVHHAWLVEDLDGGRVRILTQESQKGSPAKVMAETKPNPLVAKHQDWLDGLVATTRKNKAQ
ncbi:hypothetical protein GQ53DRAFT_743584 [Thozetella sp. PMI_491]|nr:hypothetical protein GQ53DRAFT_743584 [Thozetella sp. PMI_491]